MPARRQLPTIAWVGIGILGITLVLLLINQWFEFDRNMEVRRMKAEIAAEEQRRRDAEQDRLRRNRELDMAIARAQAKRKRSPEDIAAAEREKNLQAAIRRSQKKGQEFNKKLGR